VSDSCVKTKHIATRTIEKIPTRKTVRAVERVNAGTLKTLAMMTRVGVATAYARANIEARKPTTMVTRVKAVTDTAGEGEKVRKRVKMKRAHTGVRVVKD
jgi:hypothetical protein